IHHTAQQEILLHSDSASTLTFYVLRFTSARTAPYSCPNIMSFESSAPTTQPLQFPCKSCGATLHFAPGHDVLKCPFCGAENDIPEADIEVQEAALQELDFHRYLSDLAAGSDTVEITIVKCSNCGAETTFDPNITADECAFCGTALVGGQQSERLIKPKALLPFKITDRESHELFRKW